jgi:phosphopantothenoylcysteine decarboxylase / phosphopantothenate---cysteine ligase
MKKLTVLISAGPTREPIDPVRFLSNRSSGKMGYALAEAALLQQHRVILVSGPVMLTPPSKAQVYQVETAQEMHRTILKYSRRADVVIMAAAVADYTPVKTAKHKIKKKTNYLTLQLKKTPDILAELGRSKPRHQILIGFAAETSNLRKHARAKLDAKNLDFIIANKVGGTGSGFESDYNQAVVLDKKGHSTSFPRMTKRKLAQQLLKLILPRSKRT